MKLATYATFGLLCWSTIVPNGVAAVPEQPVPTVVTGEATAVGMTGLTLNGVVRPRVEPTSYYFEYGPTPQYGARTSIRPLPPRLAAYYAENWNDGLAGWGTRFKSTLQKSDGSSGPYINLAEPSQSDNNHIDGISAVQLVSWLYTGPVGPSVVLGGGDADLRDARMSLWVRGHDWKPNGSELMAWIQTQMNPLIGEAAGWRRANWAHTAFSLNDFLMDGKWHEVRYRLTNDSAQWTYAGNNPTAQENAGRYQYVPIGTALEHCNYDLIFVGAYVREQRPPTGSIDFDDLELVYRNHSLLFPSNGGRIVSSPDRSPEPTGLTDGWRNGRGHMWRSADDPAGPLSFVYTFTSPVTIRTIQVHQNPDWPAKEVAVSVSDDGRHFTPLTTLVMPERGAPSDNFAFRIVRGLSTSARFLKVSILSGYKKEHWGLGEIEAFGDGGTILPENEPNHVTADIGGLLPGTTIHYRLVAVTANSAVYGGDTAFMLPATAAPLATTGPATRITPQSARIEVRTNALGYRTRVFVEYGKSARYEQRSNVEYAGLQVTPRVSSMTLEGLSPGVTYHYRVVATSEAGRVYGPDRTFRTPRGTLSERFAGAPSLKRIIRGVVFVAGLLLLILAISARRMPLLSAGRVAAAALGGAMVIAAVWPDAVQAALIEFSFGYNGDHLNAALVLAVISLFVLAVAQTARTARLERSIERLARQLAGDAARHAPVHVLVRTGDHAAEEPIIGDIPASVLNLRTRSVIVPNGDYGIAFEAAREEGAVVVVWLDPEAEAVPDTLISLVRPIAENDADVVWQRADGQHGYGAARVGAIGNLDIRKGMTETMLATARRSGLRVREVPVLRVSAN